MNVTIPVLVKRDLDHDGVADDADDDIDGDGILNENDEHQRTPDALTAGEQRPTNNAVEGQPYTSTEKVINPNKPDTTVTPTETNGLTIDGNGKVTGTPNVTWTGDETEQTVNIPVEVKRGNETVNVTIPVVVYRSSKNGDSKVQPDLPEFKGGVNGELPDPVELPKVQLIITKWSDEAGNELKPADAKAPAVLGEANEALEAGEIEGYVFVRTETKGDVVTHIFRKVTPTKPEGNGDNKPQPTPEAPTDNAERKPEVVTPDEQPAETENTTTKPEASQNLLPNTGTAKGVGIFSAAAASILAGLGLIIPVKKEDEEEEETQSN